MKHFRMTRITEHDGAAYGVLTLNNEPICLTLERRWYKNEVGISCIPKGCYKLKRHISPRFGECFKVEGAHGRSDILIHAGNTVFDTTGCILLGLSYSTFMADMVEVTGVGNSKIALAKFMAVMAGENEADLEIT